MFILLIYAVASVLVGYGMFRLFVKFSKKRSQAGWQWPGIIGVVNTGMLLCFGLWFVMDPGSFSSEKEIVWSLWMVVFTVFTMYFYILAVPTSVAMYFLEYHISEDRNTRKSNLIRGLNVGSSIGLLILMYFILK